MTPNTDDAGSVPDAPVFLSTPAAAAARPRVLEEIPLLISGGSEIQRFREIAQNTLYRLSQMLRVDLKAPYVFTEFDYLIDSSRDEEPGHVPDRSLEAVENCDGVIAIVTRSIPEITRLEADVVCTDKELEDAFADRLTAGKTASLGGGLPARDESPDAAIFGQDFGCLLSVAAFSLSAIGLLLLMAFPPVGLLAWVLWGIGGAAFITSYIGLVDNCTGVLAAKEKFHLYGDQYYTSSCSFGSYSGHRWDSIAQRSVPTRARWNC